VDHQGACLSLKITIVTAVFNRAATVGEALASVRSQSWPEVEHVVIDGGSTDGTVPILQRHRNQLAVLVSEPDQGIYDALNKGLERATGDVIGLMHSDDFFADDRVLERVAAAFADPLVDAVYGDLDYVAKDDTSRIVRRWRSSAYLPSNLARGWMPPHPTLYLRRSVIERWGGFDTPLSNCGRLRRHPALLRPGPDSCSVHSPCDGEDARRW